MSQWWRVLFGLPALVKPALGYNGLPICECEKPKDVVPEGQPRFTGWCGHCGKDLAPKQP